MKVDTLKKREFWRSWKASFHGYFLREFKRKWAGSSMGLLLYPSQAVCGGDCWTQDLWQVLCPKGPLPAKPAGEMLLKTTWKSALFPQSCLQRNKQTKNTFRGKWGLLVLTTGVAENWMEKSSPQFCHIPHRHCHKNTPTPPSFSVMKTCAEIALGSYIFVFFFIFFKVCSSVNICDWILKMYSSFDYWNVRISYHR